MQGVGAGAALATALCKQLAMVPQAGQQSGSPRGLVSKSCSHVARSLGRRAPGVVRQGPRGGGQTASCWRSGVPMRTTASDWLRNLKLQSRATAARKTRHSHSTSASVRCTDETGQSEPTSYQALRATTLSSYRLALCAPSGYMTAPDSRHSSSDVSGMP